MYFLKRKHIKTVPSGTETIKRMFRDGNHKKEKTFRDGNLKEMFPAATETIKGNHTKNVSCDDGNHKIK